MSNENMNSKNYIDSSNQKYQDTNVVMSGNHKALQWLYTYEVNTGGIQVHSKSVNAYPGITGCTIPTLLTYGEKKYAKRLIEWLLCIQRSDGSFTDPEGIPYIFDTGQVLRGLISAKDIFPKVKDSIIRATEYLYSQMRENGICGFGSRYKGKIPETVHLYVLPPFIEAAKMLDKPDYLQAAENCINYYINHPDFLKLDSLTHFLAYELEALIDLNRSDLAIPLLQKIANMQALDGAVNARKGNEWICTPGLAQLAICWYKVGMIDSADKALEWLESHQLSSGGFLGSYGYGASYFPTVEISWAVKFYLDAHFLRLKNFFKRYKDKFPESISPDDERVLSILSFIKDKDKVADIGCGNGRFLREIYSKYPNCELTGIDLSPELISNIKSLDIVTKVGTLENIPAEDNYFDVVYTVEAIEHSTNINIAVEELVRVTRPGGYIIIIDKHAEQWGRLKCPAWEQWSSKDKITKMLNRYCDNVTCKTVGYDGRKSEDGLMVIWSGQKRTRLSGSEWNSVLISSTAYERIINNIKCNKITEWEKELILNTDYNEKVLEIGSGTGEISLKLAQAGRKVTILDFNDENIDFTQRCAKSLGINIEAVCCDATSTLPFANNEFDTVWQSGLLEHFTKEERQSMLREWSRIARKKLISIVPNASSLPYRFGKIMQQECGEWKYGLETPILSLREEFEKVGLINIKEYSVATNQSLKFIRDKDVAKYLNDIFKLNYEDDNWNQGYLLVTIGYK